MYCHCLSILHALLYLKFTIMAISILQRGILSPSRRNVLKIAEAGRDDLGFELGSAGGSPELGGVSWLFCADAARCRFAGLEGRARIRRTGQDGLTTNPAAHFVHAQRGV